MASIGTVWIYAVLFIIAVNYGRAQGQNFKNFQGQSGAKAECNKKEDYFKWTCPRTIAFFLTKMKTAEFMETLEEYKHNICSYLSLGSLTSMCQLVVDNSISLISMLVNHDNPGEICKLLDIHTTKLLLSQADKDVYHVDSKSSSCEQCQAIINILYNLSKNPIAKQVSNICLFAPNYFSEVCRSLIDNEITKSLLLKMVGPRWVCEQLYSCETLEHNTAGY